MNRIEKELHQFWCSHDCSHDKLAEHIRVVVPDREWNTLQETHKGSSEAKAYSLVHMWTKDEDIKCGIIPEIRLNKSVSEITSLIEEELLKFWLGVKKDRESLWHYIEGHKTSNPYFYNILEGDNTDLKTDNLINKWKETVDNSCNSVLDKKFYFTPPPRGMYKITDSHHINESDVKLASNIVDNTVGAEDRSVIKKDGIYYEIPTDKEIEEAYRIAEDYGRITVGKVHTNLFETAKEAQQVYQETKHKGLRFNEGKLRYDLVHPWSQEQMVRVLTKGSVKYEERNWERGMKWSNVLASAKRHMAAIERGEDYDIDPNCSECQKSTKDNWVCKNHTGELHAALLQTNAHFLTAYYKIYPEGDDRPKPYLSRKKIGLDIDDVLADFVGAWLERYPQNKPNFWNFDKDFGEKYEAIKNDKEFWMNIKPKIDPSELLFEPTCYITSRGVPSEWTEEWLQRNGFPAVPVYTVGLGESKVEIAKQSGIDIFVDDRFENFVELNNAGICTFLMDANHNKRYDVQARRIYSLKDLV